MMTYLKVKEVELIDYTSCGDRDHSIGSQCEGQNPYFFLITHQVYLLNVM